MSAYIRLCSYLSSVHQQFWYFLFWCGIAMLGYFLYVVFFGLSTVLSHSAAYHILYDLRMAIADRLMKSAIRQCNRKCHWTLKKYHGRKSRRD